MSFHHHIMYTARVWPERPAIVMMERVITYGMLRSGILSVASLLQSRGVRPGQMVGIHVNRPSWNLIITFAVAHLGAIGVSIGKEEDIASSGIAFDLVISRPPLTTKVSCPTAVVDDGWFVRPDRPVAPAGFPDADAICRISFSSGTTGRSKPIAHTRRSIDARLASWMLRTSHESWSRLLLGAGLGTNFAFNVALMTLSTGRTLYLGIGNEERVRMAALFSVEAIVGSNATMFDIVSILKETPTPLPSLRLCMMGGSQTSPRLAKDIQRLLCPRAMVNYASSEAGLVAFGPLANLDIERGAVGYVVPGVEIRVLSETGDVLPAGSEGALQIRTEAASRAYQPDAAGPENGSSDGWHIPGDVGRIDADGVLYITGRTDHLINVGGSKQAPELIEDEVRAAPGVSDAAVTMTDRIGGQVWVVVVAEPAVSDQSLLSWYRLNIPLLNVHAILRVEAIPRTEMGKVRREDVRRMAREAAGVTS